MKHGWVFRAITALTMAIMLALGVSSPAMAATTAVGTITYTPVFVSITTTGSFAMGSVLVNTVYYSNPGGVSTPPSATVVDGECSLHATVSASVNYDLFVNIPNFTGGSDPMTNGNSGSNGTTTFGAYSWYSGMTYTNKVIAKASGSDAMYANVSSATTSVYWGVEIKTQTQAWSGATASGSNAIISITVH